MMTLCAAGNARITQAAFSIAGKRWEYARWVAECCSTRNQARRGWQDDESNKGRGVGGLRGHDVHNGLHEEDTVPAQMPHRLPTVQGLWQRASGREHATILRRGVLQLSHGMLPEHGQDDAGEKFRLLRRLVHERQAAHHGAIVLPVDPINGVEAIVRRAVAHQLAEACVLEAEHLLGPDGRQT